MKDSVRAEWAKAVLVCAKCSRKVGGGFGADGDLPLAKALRRQMGLKKGRRAALGIVEVKCLGVCPRDAVVLVDAGQPDRWRLVSPGADLGDLARALAVPSGVAPGGVADQRDHVGDALRPVAAELVAQIERG